MKAVRYHGPQQPLRLEEVPRPEPGPGEVRVRVRAAGVCGTERHFLSGLLNLGVAPLTLGHEVVGEVDAVGPEVDAPVIGQRVIVYYYVGCGRCAHCLRGDENLCANLRAEYGFVSDGGFAESVVVPARNAVPLPDTISDVEAAPIGCSVTTAVHAAKRARLAVGETVLVFGAGAVGYGLVQFAVMAGASVIAVGRSDAKLATARDLGAAHTINATAEDVAARVHAITGGRGVDVVFELVATADTMAASVASLAARGRLVFVGYSEDAFTVHPIALVIKEAEVIGSVGNTLAELHEAIAYVASGRITTVLDRTLPLARFQEAIDALTGGTVNGRVVLIP